VRRIIANIAGGSTLYKEAKRLNDESEPSPGTKYRGIARRHGVNWCHTTIRNLVFQRAYAGTHVVNSSRGVVERSVPAIVDPDLHRRAMARMAENKRYGGGRKSRNYLLRGLVLWRTLRNGLRRRLLRSLDWATATTTTPAEEEGDVRRRGQELTCPRAKAGWLEDLVWADVRSLPREPRRGPQRVREQLEEDREGEA
jgi:hypothetical protein